MLLPRTRVLAGAASVVAAAPIPFLVVGVAIVMAWTQGGFSASVWGPLAFVILGVTAIAVAAGYAAAPSRSQQLMLVFGAAFCIWNFASIGWAQFRADALISADKSLFYFSVFFLCALTGSRHLREAILSYGFGIAGIAVLVLGRLAVSHHPASFFVGDRLLQPSGYENANVCLWMVGACALIFFGVARGTGAVVRASAVASIALLLEIAVLGESRAWFYLLPPTAVLALLLSRERWRTLIAMLLGGSAAALAAPSFTAVYRAHASAASVRHAVTVGLFTVLGAAAMGALWSHVERRLPAPSRSLQLAAAGVLVVAALAGGAATIRAHPQLDHPLRLAQRSWRDFKVPYEATNPRKGRFLVSLSSDRWRDWTVAWNAFLAHPLIGIGGDNYEARYLEQRPDPLFDPKYPHSTPLRLLSQFGLIGACLFAGFAGLALYRAFRSLAGKDHVRALLGSTALLAFAYWFAHGSLDWFWEIPALSAPVFAFLGLAAGAPALAEVRPVSAPRWILASAIGASALLVVPPWAERYLTDRALAAQAGSPSRADRELRLASTLNPFSADPQLVRASLAINSGRHAEAAQALRAAIRREPDGWYGHLQLAILQVQERRFTEAARSVARARELNPKDPVAALVDRLIARRQPFPPSLPNDLYLKQTEARFGPG